MVSEEEHQFALDVIEAYKNQFVKLTKKDNFFVGMNFTSEINGYKTKCVVTSLDKKEYNFDGNPFIATLVKFDGVYNSMSPLTSSIQEYKNTWTLSKGQIISMGAVWAKDRELADFRNKKLESVLNNY